jgi:hypothetical protein
MPEKTGGTLRIVVESESMFLGGLLPVEVRDATQRVVERTRGSSSLPLDPGLYSVTVVLPTGERADQVVAVKPGEPTEVTFRPPPTAAAPTVAVAETMLEGTTGAKFHHEASSTWVFVPDGEPASVPTASFRLPDRGRLDVSLPLNPRDDYPLNACSVAAVVRHGRATLETSFSPERRVASAISGVLRSGELVASAEILRQAANLLFAKYQDPPAAALGALTLHRLGQLEDRRQWVRNLAVGFPWLPDGSMLLAALLRDDPDPGPRDRGLDVLLTATAQRPLYTDGLSLGMELLRRWPGDARKDERYTRLEGLSEYSAGAVWDALTLTTVHPPGDPVEQAVTAPSHAEV